MDFSLQKSIDDFTCLRVISIIFLHAAFFKKRQAFAGDIVNEGSATAFFGNKTLLYHFAPGVGSPLIPPADRLASVTAALTRAVRMFSDIAQKVVPMGIDSGATAILAAYNVTGEVASTHKILSCCLFCFTSKI